MIKNVNQQNKHCTTPPSQQTYINYIINEQIKRMIKNVNQQIYIYIYIYFFLNTNQSK